MESRVSLPTADRRHGEEGACECSSRSDPDCARGARLGCRRRVAWRRSPGARSNGLQTARGGAAEPAPPAPRLAHPLSLAARYSHSVLRQLPARISLRSRERKLRLFLDLLEPGPATTVLDVGVTDAAFGAGSTDNFFEARYPWPEQITAGGAHRARPLSGRGSRPRVTAVRADGRSLPFEDGQFDLGFSNAVIEHVAGGRAEQRRFVSELCRVAGRGVRHDPQPALPARSALAPAVRPLAAGR